MEESQTELWEKPVKELLEEPSETQKNLQMEEYQYALLDKSLTELLQNSQEDLLEYPQKKKTPTGIQEDFQVESNKEFLEKSQKQLLGEFWMKFLEKFC